MSNYSQLNPKVLDKKGRERVAMQILTILKEHLGGKNPKIMKVLDIGCSSGIISSILADHFGKVVGIDIDKSALSLTKKVNKIRGNITFIYMDAKKMSFPKNTFDLVLCNQVYYYIDNIQSLMDEIYRVLKPSGICLFAGINKYSLNKPFEPCPVYYKSLWELKKICNRFTTYYYSQRILLLRFKKLKNLFNFFSFWNQLEWIMPNFVWILRKPESPSVYS